MQRITRRIKNINPYVLFVGVLIFIFSLPFIKFLNFSATTIRGQALLLNLFHDSHFQKSLLNSVTIASITTFIGTSTGLILALFVGLSDLHRLRLWSFIIFLVFFLPPTFLAIAWVDIGVLMDHAFNIPNPMYHPFATIILLSIHLFPICYFMILESLRRMPQNLIEAGRSCGLNSKGLLRHIILPLLRPAIVKSAMLIWFSCLGHFTFYALLGIPGQFTTLTTLIYSKLTGFGLQSISEVVLICLILLTVGLSGVILLKFLTGKDWHYRITTKSIRQNTFVSKRVRILVYSFLWIICTAIALPFIKLVMTSLTPKALVSFSWQEVSLENYYYIFSNYNVRKGILNSLFLGSAAATILFLKSAIFEYGSIIHERRIFGRARIFFQSLYLLPGSILAISMILLFLKPFSWMDFLRLNTLYDTLFIIFVAYLIRFFAFHLNIVHSSGEKFSKRWIESAKSSGAKTFRTVKDIFLPIMSPSLFQGSFLVFILILHEVTVSALLPSSHTQTLGVVLLTLMEHGDTKATAALCILVTIALVILRLFVHMMTKAYDKKIYGFSHK